MAKKISPRDSDKHDKAYQLYVAGHTQKEICNTLDINAKTLKRWIDDGVWSGKRATKNISLDSMINRLMSIADDMLNDDNFKDNLAENSNAIAKLIRQIKSLKNGTTINDRYQTFIDFIDWLIIEARSNKEVSDSVVKIINLLQNKYLKELCDKD